MTAIITPSIRACVLTAALLALAVLSITACFNAAPSECIEAAEAAGLPDEAIEQLRNPGDLNAVERAALNRALSQAGIDDVCEVSSDSASADSEDSEVTDSKSANPISGSNVGQSETTQPNGGTDQSGTSETSGENPQPTQRTVAAQRSARIPVDDEHRRRCRFWALNNLEPLVYAEFSKLDPDSMDDLDRILWRTKLHDDDHLGYYDDELTRYEDTPLLLPRNPGIYCRDYWAEQINRSNADLRNHRFEAECRFDLERLIASEYRRLADAANYQIHSQEEDELLYNTPNQYVRILQWLGISGDELLASDNPPYRILQEQSRHLHAYYANEIITEDLIESYSELTDTKMDMEWLGILSATGMYGSSSEIVECHYYYPQVFYGYWVPLEPGLTPIVKPEVELPKYEAPAMPLYLPKTVNAERVRPSYPLGRSADGYHFCRDYGDTELVGYYYVEHPAGDYCEKMP